MGRILDRANEIAEEAFIAASGPGGQNVNKVATAVQLRVNIYALGLPPRIFHRLKDIAGNRLNQAGEIVIDARSHRTQDANRTRRARTHGRDDRGSDQGAEKARKDAGEQGWQAQAPRQQEGAGGEKGVARQGRPLAASLDFHPIL